MPLKKILFNLKYFDWQLLVVTLILISFGLASLYSVALSQEKQDFHNFKKQILFLAVGVFVLLFLSLLDYKWLQSYSLAIYLFSLLLLVAVLFLGKTFSGTTGWFTLYGFTFQPVELAKISLIIFLANYLSSQINKKEYLSFIILSGLPAGILFLIVMLQPDCGSAILLFFIWFFMLLIAGVKKKYLVLIILLILVTFTFSWFYIFKAYQKDRIQTFLNPDSDPYGRGYQVSQAVIAVGAGGLSGRGLGFGSQSQLKFIPAAQTDFIFAVVAEELGLVGVSLLLAAYAFFFYRLLKIAKSAPNNFALFVIFGISIIFFSQFFINIGMNLGLLPVTGISLPFLSYGGSFLLSSLTMVGILESIAIRSIKYRV